MKLLRVAVILIIACSTSTLGFAQSIEDVEPQPYGSFAGGKVDTVDLATGNLFLNIPLISYPQLGRLPPLTFAIGLNNAPYAMAGGCDAEEDVCTYTPYRYDPSPPGGISLSGTSPGALQDAKLGAYLTSSFEGAIVSGYENDYSQIVYSLTDVGGTSHELASDSASWGTYRTMDGAGYTFIPSHSNTQGDNGYDYSQPSNIVFGGNSADLSWQYWLENSLSSDEEELRAGTIFSPTGIQYNNNFIDESQYLGLNSYDAPTRLLLTTESDASGQNKITRGPWYWTGNIASASTIAAFYQPTNPSGANYPVFADSENRSIPDIISLQETALGIAGDHHLCPTIPNQPSAITSIPWDTPGPGGTTLHYQICYAPLNLTYAWFDTGTGSPPPNGIWEVGYAIQSILLPDQTSYWGFVYDQSMTGTACDPNSEYSPCGSGDLTEVLLPTGGSISYTYENTDSGENRCLPSSMGTGVCHAVASRTENDGEGHEATIYYQYHSVADPQQGAHYPPIIYTTTEIKPSGASTVHIFTPLGTTHNGANVTTLQLFETETDYYSATYSWSPETDPRGKCILASGCLRSVLTTFSNSWDLPDWSSSSEGHVTRIVNAVPTQVAVTNPANGATVIDNKTYSPLFSAAAISCQQPGSCAPLDTQFPPFTSPPTSYSPAINFLSPTEEDVNGPNGQLQTTVSSYEFNNPTSAAYANGIAPALPVSITNTDSTKSAVYSETVNGYDSTGIGNLISVGHWLNTAGRYLFTTTSFNIQNEPYSTVDPNLNQTYVSSFQCSGLYPRTVVTAYQSSTTLQEQANYRYDCNTGNLIGSTDPNGFQTTYIYSSDPLGRLTNVLRGTGTDVTTGAGGLPIDFPATQLSTINIDYPNINSAIAHQDKSTLYDESITSSSGYDGLGRPIQATNPAGYTVTTSYNSNGQVATVTNPEGTPAPTDGTTSYYYDSLARIVKQVEQDGAITWRCYNGIQDVTNPQPNCSANPVNTNAGAVFWADVTDDSGHHHQEVSNALGQLIAVVEPNPQTGLLSLETDYTYDPNGNLATISQLGAPGETIRSRSFKYDSLSRLMWSQNPETGVICYGHGDGTLAGCQNDGYDLDGNLKYKTDARGVVTSYSYDALNRLTSESYSSNDSSGTPSSCYQYDTTAMFGIGRLGTQWTQKGACASTPPSNATTLTSVSAYDYMGRITSETQCVLSNCSANSQPTYSYDLAGDLTSYGDGRGVMAFTSQYDSAARLQMMTAGPNSFTLFSAPSYSAAGGLTNAFYGSGSQNASPLTQSRTYDSRLRLTGETDQVTQ